MRHHFKENTGSDDPHRQCKKSAEIAKSPSRAIHHTSDPLRLSHETPNEDAPPDMTCFHDLFYASGLTAHEIEEYVTSIYLVATAFVDLSYGVHPAQGVLARQSDQDELRAIVGKEFSPYHGLK